MNTHSIELDGYYARSRGNSTIYLGTAGSHGNEQLQVTQGKGWEGLTVQVVFHPCKVAVQLPANGVLDVPWEATAQPLTAMQGRIVFQGFDQDRLVNSTDLAYSVASHSPALGRDEQPYTPGIVEGVLNQMAADKDAILQAAQQTGQAKEAAAASAAEAASSAANAQQSAAAANETLTQVQTAGQEAQQKVKDAETEALDKIAAAAPALPAVSTDAAWQSVTVKPDGSGYNLAAMAPIEATIRPTVTGNPAVCKDSIAWAFQGLRIYGKSTQDGTPSPENPVPIVSAGEGGSIALSITDGAEQSQSFTFSTPSGLPGVLVDSGGNYVDGEGQQWASDIKDLGDKTETQNVLDLTFDGSADENWILQSGVELGNRFRIVIRPAIMTSYKGSANSMTNLLPIEINGATSNTPNCYTIVFDGSNSQLYVALSGTESLEEFKAYLQENPMRLLARLITPITTPLSDEEVAAYRALTTYSGTTVVSTSEPVAGIEARYIMDGNKYRESVDKRLAALEAAQTGI